MATQAASLFMGTFQGEINSVFLGLHFLFYAAPPALQEKVQEKDQDDDDDDKSKVHFYVRYSVKMCA